MTQADSVHSTPPLNTSAINPTAGLDWLDVQPDATPQDIFRAIGRLRKEVRDEIDRLIRFLDETDNHIELEPADEADDADDEPSLGSFDRMTDQSKAWQQRSLWAFHDANDGEQDNADAEPSLGSLDGRTDQTGWAADNRGDYELDHAEAGIGDWDGLLEQVGTQDWQQGAMA
jgi:hypothetical protein